MSQISLLPDFALPSMRFLETVPSHLIYGYKLFRIARLKIMHNRERLTIDQRFLNFLSGGHDERTILEYRLVERLTGGL